MRSSFSFRASLFCGAVAVLPFVVCSQSHASGQSSPAGNYQTSQPTTTKAQAKAETEPSEPDQEIKTTPILATTIVNCCVKIDAGLVEYDSARRVFSTWVANNYAVVRVHIENQCSDEQFILQGVSLDLSRIGQNSSDLRNSGASGSAAALPAAAVPLTGDHQIPNTGSHAVQETLEAGSRFSARNLVVNGLVLVGAVAGGYAFLGPADAAKGIAAYAGDFMPGLQKLWPDRQIEQRINVLLYGYQDKIVIAKGDPGVTYLFFPRDKLVSGRPAMLFSKDLAAVLDPAQLFLDSATPESRGVRHAHQALKHWVTQDAGIRGNDEYVASLIRSSCFTEEPSKTAGSRCIPKLPNLSDEETIAEIRKLKTSIARVSLQGVSVELKGIMAVDADALPATITNVSFDEENQETGLWSDAKKQHSGLIKGKSLLNGRPEIIAISIPNANPAQLAEYFDKDAVSIVSKGSSDTELHFKVQFKQPIPQGAKLTFRILKTVILKARSDDGNCPEISAEGAPYVYSAENSPLAPVIGLNEKKAEFPSGPIGIPEINKCSDTKPAKPCPHEHNEVFEGPVIGFLETSSSHGRVNGRKVTNSQVLIRGDHLATGPGEIMKVILEDGVTLQLSQNTNVQLRATLTESKPVATLISGNVLVSVVHRDNVERPILFNTPTAQVQDLGTVFSLSAQGRESLVLCLEGQLNFLPIGGNSAVPLTSGMAAYLDVPKKGHATAKQESAFDIAYPKLSLGVQALLTRDGVDLPLGSSPSVDWNIDYVLRTALNSSTAEFDSGTDKAKALDLCVAFAVNSQLCRDMDPTVTVVGLRVEVSRNGVEEEHFQAIPMHNSVPIKEKENLIWEWKFKALKRGEVCEVGVKLIPTFTIATSKQPYGKLEHEVTLSYSFKPAWSFSGGLNAAWDWAKSPLSEFVLTLLGLMSLALLALLRKRIKGPKALVWLLGLTSDAAAKVVDAKPEDGGAKKE
jgi:hypothetical protein